MYRIITIGVILATAAWAQMSAPRIGIALDRQARVAPVYGVGGNFIAGKPLAGDVLSAAAWDAASIIKTASEVRVYNAAGTETARRRAAQGMALFAFSQTGDAQYIWLTETHELLRADGNEIRPARFPQHALQGEVLAIGANAGGLVDFAIARNGAVEMLRIRLSDGAVIATSPLPGAVGAPLLLAGGAIAYGAKDAIVLRDAAGHERRTEFRHPVAAISSMSNRWALATVADSTRRYAIRLSDGASFQIPEAQ